MMNTKMKFLPCAIALAFSGLYSVGASAHGFIKSPPSRSFVFYADSNEANLWPADEIEAPKLPAGGLNEADNPFENTLTFPPDGKLASGNNVNRTAMDNEAYAWPQASIKAGVQNFDWVIPAQHRTTYFTYYITKQDWKSKPGYGQRLTAEMFEDQPFCHTIYPSAASGGKTHPTYYESHTCNVPARSGEQKIYAVWRVRDTPNAFYQMIDVKFDGGEEVIAPVAVVPSDLTVKENVESRGYSLDGSNSQNAVSYHWSVVGSDGDKFALQEHEGGAWVSEVKQAKALALIKPNTQGKAVYQLTVTGKDGSINSKRVTVTVTEKGSVVPPGGDFPAWEQGKTYVIGDKVIFNNIKYIAKYETLSQPGSGDAWTFADADQITPWNSTMTYVAGNKVTYDGKVWRAAYWTLGNTPGQHAVWVAQ